jgi:hypothetical protein
MSEREAIVGRAIAALNEGDWQALADCMHPEMRLTQPVPDVGQTSYPSHTGTYSSREQTAAMLERMAAEYDGLEIELRWTEEVGTDALLYEFLWLMGPERERSAQLSWAVSRFRDGLVLSSSIFSSESAARQAIERGA